MAVIRRSFAPCFLLMLVSLIVLQLPLLSRAEETRGVDQTAGAVNAADGSMTKASAGEQSASAGQESAVDRYGDVKVEENAGSQVPDPDSKNQYGDISPKEYEGAEAKVEGQEEISRIDDPLEPMNRFFFQFNDKLYFWLVKPVSQGYKRVVSEDFRTIFGNFYRNVAAPIRIANNFLQFKAWQAGTEIFRFVINSTIGVGGLRDVARDAFGVEAAPEDLGQTFGFYGFGPGFYLVLPVLGPSSARDGLGLAGDWFLTPVTYVDPALLRYGIRAHDQVNYTSFRIGDYEAFKKASLDPYVAMREAYAENRAAEIKK